MKILCLDPGQKNLGYAIVWIDNTKGEITYNVIKFGCIDVNGSDEFKPCKNTSFKFNFDEGEMKYCCDYHKYLIGGDKKEKKIDEKCKILIKKFDKIFNDDEYDCVIIENQPSFRAPTIKSISMIIMTYFCMKKNDVEFQNPICKMFGKKISDELTKSQKYKQTKSFTGIICENILNKDLMDVIRCNKKIDDITDSICHCIAYYHKKTKTTVSEKILKLI